MIDSESETLEVYPGVEIEHPNEFEEDDKFEITEHEDVEKIHRYDVTFDEEREEIVVDSVNDEFTAIVTADDLGVEDLSEGILIEHQAELYDVLVDLRERWSDIGIIIDRLLLEEENHTYNINWDQMDVLSPDDDELYVILRCSTIVDNDRYGFEIGVSNERQDEDMIDLMMANVDRQIRWLRETLWEDHVRDRMGGGDYGE